MKLKRISCNVTDVIRNQIICDKNHYFFPFLKRWILELTAIYSKTILWRCHVLKLTKTLKVKWWPSLTIAIKLYDKVTDPKVATKIDVISCYNRPVWNDKTPSPFKPLHIHVMLDVTTIMKNSHADTQIKIIQLSKTKNFKFTYM